MQDTGQLAVCAVLDGFPIALLRDAGQTRVRRRDPMSDGSAASSAASNKLPAYVRPGFHNIAPYILVDGAAKFIDFLKAAFAGSERIRMPRPDGLIMHAEVGIGNSVIELGDINEQHPARPATVHVYVDDADATYERALRAGATSIYAVEDQPWGDRQGCVQDQFGNVWRIAMPKSWTPGPEGLLNVQPYLYLRDADKMIPFAEAAFGAESRGAAKSDAGKIMHATIKIGGATFEIEEAGGEFQPKPCYLHMYVADADACYANALRAGATSVEAPGVKPYGERSAPIKDPFGNTWYVATYLGDCQK
jgi:PhnB protein